MSSQVCLNFSSLDEDKFKSIFDDLKDNLDDLTTMEDAPEDSTQYSQCQSYFKEQCNRNPFLKKHGMCNTKSGFVVGLPNIFFDSWFKRAFWSLLVSFLVVIFAIRKFDIVFFMIWFMMAIILNVILYSVSASSGISGAVPVTNYPLPPHLGLDGVSNETRSSY